MRGVEQFGPWNRAGFFAEGEKPWLVQTCDAAKFKHGRCARRITVSWWCSGKGTLASEFNTAYLLPVCYLYPFQWLLFGCKQRRLCPVGHAIARQHIIDGRMRCDVAWESSREPFRAGALVAMLAAVLACVDYLVEHGRLWANPPGMSPPWPQRPTAVTQA